MPFTFSFYLYFFYLCCHDVMTLYWTFLLSWHRARHLLLYTRISVTSLFPKHSNTSKPNQMHEGAPRFATVGTSTKLIKMINNVIWIRWVVAKPVLNKLPYLTKQRARQINMILGFLKIEYFKTNGVLRNLKDKWSITKFKPNILLKMSFFFCGGEGLNLKPCKYYVLSLPTELSLWEHWHEVDIQKITFIHFFL